MNEIDNIPSVDQLYEDIAGEAAINNVISDLGVAGDTAAQLRADIANDSNASRNRIIAYIVAVFHYKLRLLFKLFKHDVTNLSRDQQYGTKRWYVYKAKQYQYGHELIHTDKDSRYAVEDLAARVVDQASVEESAYTVIVKAAQDSPQGFRKLTVDQVAGLQDYFSEISPAGIRVVVRSTNPDLVRIYGKVVCDAKQGLPGIKSQVEATIASYLENLNFDGILSINEMRQRVLALQGVIDWEITNVQSRIYSSPDFHTVSRVRRSYAGYMRIDALHPLSSTLQFINANV